MTKSELEGAMEDVFNLLNSDDPDVDQAVDVLADALDIELEDEEEE